jgi:hypothetical protein
VGLAVAAAITTALALCGLAVVLARAADRRHAALAFAIALPLQPLVFYLVRLPIDGLLRTTFGISGWVVLVSLLYAPLTEEPAKWLTAAVPAVRKAIMVDPVTIALAVGIGFGIGEIWFLARALIMAPNYPDAPFWMFGGFMFERLEVVFLHGAFVALPFVQWARGRSFALAGAAAMLLHFLLNFPIYLAQIDAFGLGHEMWVSVLLLWGMGFVAACAVMVAGLSRRVRVSKAA